MLQLCCGKLLRHFTHNCILRWIVFYLWLVVIFRNERQKVETSKTRWRTGDANRDTLQLYCSPSGLMRAGNQATSCDQIVLKSNCKKREEVQVADVTLFKCTQGEKKKNREISLRVCLRFATARHKRLTFGNELVQRTHSRRLKQVQCGRAHITSAFTYSYADLVPICPLPQSPSD